MDSRIMEMNLNIIDKIVYDACAALSTDGKHVTLPQLRHALQSCKQLTLTPFQINAIHSSVLSADLPDTPPVRQLCNEQGTVAETE